MCDVGLGTCWQDQAVNNHYGDTIPPRMYRPAMALVIIKNVLNLVLAINLTGVKIWLRPGKGHVLKLR